MSEKNLPTLADLSQDIELAFKNDQFKLLLNQTPPETWVKKNALANNSKYLPIDKTEFLLDKIFQEWKVEVKEVGTMFNSVFCVVRVHYKNPVTLEWSYHDGVGAKDMQKDANTTLSMETIKSAAVQMALPTAKSLAIKDACDHLGKLFGRDLNRKDTLEFSGAYSKDAPKDKSEERLAKLIDSCKSREELSKFFGDCTTKELSEIYDKKYKSLK